MDPSNDNNRFIGATFQSHWLLFGLVGALLLLAGLVAIIVPTISSIAPSELLGLVLAFVGIIQIAQSGKMLGQVLFAWHLALGLLAAVSGVVALGSREDVSRSPGRSTNMMTTTFSLRWLLEEQGRSR